VSAGYSGTPLPGKLGIRAGMRVAFVDAPPEFAELVAPLPDGVEVVDAVDDAVELIVFFTVARSALEREVAALQAAIAPDGSLWVAWPKRSSGVESDMTEDLVREVALPRGLVDNKVCAIDATWSGLRLVVRLSERA
jgi:hypothetical protein